MKRQQVRLAVRLEVEGLGDREAVGVLELERDRAGRVAELQLVGARLVERLLEPRRERVVRLRRQRERLRRDRGGLRRDDVDRLAVRFEIVLQHPVFQHRAARRERGAHVRRLDDDVALGGIGDERRGSGGRGSDPRSRARRRCCPMPGRRRTCRPRSAAPAPAAPLCADGAGRGATRPGLRHERLIGHQHDEGQCDCE